MKDSIAEGLRTLWKELGSPTCPHHQLEKEVGFAGVPTDYHVCVVCGAQVKSPPKATIIRPFDAWYTLCHDDQQELPWRALQLRPSLKVALFTGHSDQHVAQLGLKTDAFLLFRKPCSLSTLVDICRQLLKTPLSASYVQTATDTV